MLLPISTCLENCGLTSLNLIVQLLTCSPARVATTVARDSRNTCRRWKAVGGGCACDRASALSDVSAPHWEMDQRFSQRGVVDGWATRGRAKLGRTHVPARDVARVCGALALRCAEVWRIDSLRNLLELKYVQCSSRPREQQPCELSCTLAGRWMKFWLNARVQVFRCLRSVGHGCYDGV